MLCGYTLLFKRTNVSVSLIIMIFLTKSMKRRPQTVQRRYAYVVVQAQVQLSIQTLKGAVQRCALIAVYQIYFSHNTTVEGFLY